VALGLAVCLALVLAPAQPAAAAVFNLTADARAEQPDIAVDDAGVAHVVWNVQVIGGDDPLVYCRVPRGARACDVTQVLALPKEGHPPQVVLTRSGEVALVSPRLAFPSTRVYAAVSADGGSTFAAPAVIAERFYGAGQEIEFGPGDFSLSLVGGFGGGNEGVIYQAASLAGMTTAAADLTGGDWTKAFDVSVGFPDPVTPMVAYSGGAVGQPSRIYFRRWGGSGDYNDAGTWEPEAVVPGTGSEPKLASGLRGVYLIYQGAEPPYQYFVRRFDGTNFPGGKNQKVVSDPRTDQSAIFRDFLEDGEGNLHAVFRQRSKEGAWGLRHRVQVAGAKIWSPVEILVAGRAADELFNLRVGAGAGAGGAVVGDHNGEGPVWFVPFKGSGAAGGDCKPAIKLGKATARALEGCFKRNGKEWVTSGSVKLNGVDIEPLGAGDGASASAAFHVTATPGQRTLTTSAKANVRVGKVVLERGLVAWKLPPGNGKVVRLNSPDGSVFRDLGKFAKKLFEFPVDGDAELLIVGAGAKIPTHLQMPGLLGGITGDTTLETDQAGQIFGGMKVDVPSAAIGLLHIAGIDVTYDGENRFTGEAKVELPPAYSKPVKVVFAFEDGELSRLEIDPAIEFSLPGPLPIVGSSPTPIVGLDSIGFTYLRKPDSRLFQGNLLLIAGPKLFGFQVVDLDGTVALEFPLSGPTMLKANGDLSVVRLPLANAFATYTVGVPGTLEFGGGYSVLGISGSVQGFVDLTNGSFSASGKASFGPLGGKAVMTDSGFGACITNPVGDDPGVSWKWKSPVPKFECPGSGSAGASASATSASTSAAGGSATSGESAAGVRASVQGKGRKRSVRFRLRRVAGRRVTFAEEAKRVYREIGSSGKARGAMRFHPAPGPGGKRRIVAILEQDGVPYDKLTVARYKAPPTRRLRQPGRVGLKRRGGKLVVGWTRVKGARGYEVRVNLPRDGRRLLFFPPPKRRGLSIRGVEPSDLARVSVAALGPDLRPGREAKAKLKPKKQRRGKRGRDGRRR
jgi:hypothetical protein